MAKQQKQLSEADRSAARKLDIAFIIIGLAIFFGLGALFLRGVAGHLAYLTADDKIEVPAKLVSYEVSNSNSKTVKNANGIDEETHDTTYDLTYEYSIGDQVFTYVRENEPTYNEDDITLRLYRSGSEPYQQTDMYGMWAGLHWALLLLSAYIGIRLFLSGVKSLRKSKQAA
ncbi:MAG: hypothetical protein IKI77_05215 [Oscillospiraceae bacterium]|nr:hypothetical protein [Oscillospiraceae bacterium]